MFKRMFENIGQQIKDIAYTIFIFEAVGTVLGGIFALIFGIVNEEFYIILIGFLAVLLGPLAAFFTVCLAYAFGNLVEKVDRIEECVSAKMANEEDENERIYVLNQLLDQGVITEEEYQKSRSKM